MLIGDVENNYINWVVNEISEDEIIFIYDENDFLQQNEPIGEKIINYGTDHIEELKCWLNDHAEWKIKWHSL